MDDKQDPKDSFLSINTGYNISAEYIIKTLFSSLIFLSSYSLIFTFLQNNEEIKEESVVDAKVKDIQKKSLYLSIIPTIISTFIIINTPGMIVLLLTILTMFVFVNS